jgi:hypothetical protein
MRSIVKNPTVWIGIISLIMVLFAVSWRFYKEINTMGAHAQSIGQTHKIEPAEQLAHSGGCPSHS